MNIYKYMHGKNFHYFVVIFLIAVFIFIYATISIISHDHFQTFGWDLGYFDQVIWKVNKGIFPFSTLSHVNLLAGHFTPILFLYALLYSLWTDPRMLLLAQAIVVVSAAIPLYILSFKKSGSRIFSFAIVIAYLLFIGTQWSILNEFHEATVAPLFLILIFYALEMKHKKIFWLSLLGLLATKEEMALLCAAIGAMMYFHFKQKISGAIIFIFSTVFFFFLTGFFMPAISESGAYYHPHLSSVAKTPGEFTLKILTNPFFAIKSLVTPPEKVSLIIQSLLSFGILPLFAPLPILLPLLEQFLIRLLYSGPQFTMWQNTNHHAAPAAMLLAISSVYAAILLKKRVKRLKKRYWLVISIWLLSVTLILDIIQKSPIHSILKTQLYETSDWMRDNYNVLKKVPSEVPVAAQNSLLPHLSQRNKVYLLPEIYDAQYVVVDLVDGPNKFSPLTKTELENLMDELIKDNLFTIEYTSGSAYLLRKL